MSSEVGSGHFSIYPTMPGFRSTVARETQSAGAAGARAFEGGFRGAGTRAGRTLGTDMRSALTSSAGDLGAAQTRQLTSEIASASAALAKTRLKQQDEAGKVRVAETRLAEAIARSGATSSQAVAAEERLAAARRTHAAATTAVTGASTRLRSAQTSLATAQQQAAEAARQAAASASEGTRGVSDRLRGLASATSNGLGAVLRTASSVGSRIGESIGSGFRAAQTTAGLALGAITVKIGSLVPGAVTASDAIDKFKSTLNFAGIDSGQIDALTKSTQEYADRTVYGLSDIQSVTAQLAANGVANFDKLAEAGGNLNAVAGGNAETFKSVGMVLTQTAGQGKLTTENWNQLSDAIPGASGKLQEALAAAGAYTGNFREAMEKGEISAEEFNQAILDLGLTDVAKDAATSTKTIEGAVGGLDAAITGGLVKVIEPLKPLITGTLTAAAGGFTKFFDRVSTGVSGLVALFGKGDFTSAFRETFGVTEDSPVVDFLLTARDAVIGFTSSLPNLTSLIGPLVGVLGVSGLAGVLSRIGPLTAVLPGLGGALSFLAGPIGLVAAGLAGLALSGGDLTGLVTSFGSVFSTIVAAIPGIVQQVATLVPQLVTAILAQVPALLAAGTGIINVLLNGLVTAIPAVATGAVQLVSGLMAAIIAALPTIIQGASQLVTALIQGIVAAIPLLVSGGLQLVTGLLNAIVGALPMIIDGAIQLVSTLVTGLVDAIPLLITAALQLITGLLTAIVSALPQIIEGGIKLLMALIQGIIQALPQLLTAALDLVMGLLEAIITNLPLIIEAGIQLLLSLVTGLIAALPDLITAAINLVLQLVVGLITMLPKLIEAGIQLVVSLITGLVEAIPQLVEMMPQIVEAIWNGLAGVDWLDLGTQIVMGIINGLMASNGALLDAIVELASGAFEGFKDFFGIASPAKRMIGPGRDVVRGAVAGVDGEASTYGDSLVNMAKSASQRAQDAMGTVTTTMTANVAPGAAGGASAGVPGGIVQNNNFEHMDPEIAIEAANQRLAAAARRATT